MADDTRKGDRESQTAEDAALSARLRTLGERLQSVESRRPHETASPGSRSNDRTALARAVRMSAELVAGVIVGAAIGYFLDRWLGTSPIAFIVFVLLGFTAGVFNVIRATAPVPATRSLGRDPPKD